MRQRSKVVNILLSQNIPPPPSFLEPFNSLTYFSLPVEGETGEPARSRAFSLTGPHASGFRKEHPIRRTGEYSRVQIEREVAEFLGFAIVGVFTFSVSG